MVNEGFSGSLSVDIMGSKAATPMENAENFDPAFCDAIERKTASDNHMTHARAEVTARHAGMGSRRRAGASVLSTHQ